MELRVRGWSILAHVLGGLCVVGQGGLLACVPCAVCRRAAEVCGVPRMRVTYENMDFWVALTSF